ncbi:MULTISPECIES: hypothetical protein [Bradyrhizobium]|jgi:hypothetical protein|nr:hypothetical protein [Bradyrhizobium elkanii]MCP1972902.1 hypothetical protein [Bradyrhizobium elkanii]MCS3520099.1 hypothetical protein [Bradyrhizobium elkanii]MCS4067754.1 hypothetical protein [Bradyrhizobium elkanii]MCS4083290.1 hypothetical protein [Bradyrhizobium elkanii]MCS4105590.1 hypothetical protein [Bradyrhizobium elkanii]
MLAILKIVCERLRPSKALGHFFAGNSDIAAGHDPQQRKRA